MAVHESNGLARGGKVFLKALFFAVLALVGAVTVSVPFLYESMTLWYKFGVDRTLLQAAQVAGLLALFALFLQLLAAARPAGLVELFGLAAVMRFHRANGWVVAGLALVHVVMVLAPEGFSNLPLGAKHWPEQVGAALLLVVWLLAVSGRFREQLSLGYTTWRAFHRPLGYLCLGLALVHVRAVSDTFAQTVPQFGLFILAALLVVFVAKGVVGRSR